MVFREIIAFLSENHMKPQKRNFVIKILIYWMLKQVVTFSFKAAPCTIGTGHPFPGGKARPGRDADHSSPSNAEVVNE
jgi:hypothetical protein